MKSMKSCKSNYDNTKENHKNFIGKTEKASIKNKLNKLTERPTLW